MARFAIRDLRGGLGGLRIFLLCIALGVAAIVGVESLARALDDGLGREGRVILGGDASFSLIHRRLSAAEQQFLESYGSLSTVATMRAMARAESDDAALVELKAVEPSWPRIGAAVLAPSMPLDEALSEKDGAFGAAAEEALLARLNLKLGDVIRIGEAKFAIRTVLTSEPDRLATGVGLGPRVLISQAALDATGLVQPGSLVRWTTRVIMGGAGGAPDEAAVRALLGEAKRAFPQAGWEARSRLNVSPDFSRDLDRFAEFLTLAGLLSLVVGGVGVANAAQGFVERKRATLAILKAIGATGASVVGLALLEFSIVALIGALAGAALGAAIPICRRLAVRVAAADPARAVDRAERDRAWGRVWTADGARLLDRAARTGARPAGDDADPRSGRGASGLAPQALSRRRGARWGGAGRAGRSDEPTTFGRGVRRMRDRRRLSGAAARRARHGPSGPPRPENAVHRMAHGAGRDRETGRADGVGRAVAGPGPGGAGCAHSHRCEYARRVASVRARRDAELLFPRCARRRRRRISRLPEARGARRQNQ